MTIITTITLEIKYDSKYKLKNIGEILWLRVQRHRYINLTVQE